jgi:hypothetical protein
MKTLPTPPFIEKDRFGSSLPLLLIFGLAFIGVLACFASVRSVQAGVGTQSYSAPALFNQANASAHDGKTALAIAFYERAQLLAPGDSNISSNLQWVREKAGLPAVAQSWFDRAVSWASPNTMACLGCLGLIFTGAGILGIVSRSRGRPLMGLAILAGTGLMALSISNAVVTWQKCDEAVVITPDAPARISPTTLGETSFKLASGALTTLHGRYHDFVLVNDTTGHSGWVRQSDLVPLMPEPINQPADAQTRANTSF